MVSPKKNKTQTPLQIRIAEKTFVLIMMIPKEIQIGKSTA
jgi:hypothetical protein